jgi:hypothetical protein
MKKAELHILSKSGYIGNYPTTTINDQEEIISPLGFNAEVQPTNEIKNNSLTSSEIIAPLLINL